MNLSDYPQNKNTAWNQGHNDSVRLWRVCNDRIMDQRILPQMKKKMKAIHLDSLRFWSEWRDSNPRPHGPEPCAIPSFATPRFPLIIMKNIGIVKGKPVNFGVGIGQLPGTVQQSDF